jgi:hypothetical protein
MSSLKWIQCYKDTIDGINKHGEKGNYTMNEGDISYIRVNSQSKEVH